MTDAPLTLKALFVDDPSKPAAEQIDLDPCVEAMKVEGKAPPRAVGPALIGAMKGALDDILSVDLGDVMGASWGKLKVVKEAMAATRDAPGTTIVAPLLEHAIKSSHEPKIELYIGAAKLCDLAFQIGLNLKLKEVSLAVSGGRITGVHAGVLTGEGTLTLGGIPLVKSTLKEFKLPGRLRFSRTPEATVDPA
jgi:hypothetical protein